jgi:hypothetical protein
MTLSQVGPAGRQRGFADRLLEIIDAGRRTATYKPALLIALLDLCARHSDADGRAPQVLYTQDIAEQAAVLYWPQAIPYLVRIQAIRIGQRSRRSQVANRSSGVRAPRLRVRGCWAGVIGEASMLFLLSVACCHRRATGKAQESEAEDDRHQLTGHSLS